MTVRSVRDLAAAVRGRRADLGISQEELARRAGVSRKWVYEFEAGKPGVELAFTLRVLDALGLAIEFAPTSRADTARVDLDEILDAHRDR